MQLHDDWYLCTGHNCDHTTRAADEQQAAPYGWFTALSADCIRMHSIRAFLAREVFELEPAKVSDSELLKHVQRLLSTGRLHLHARPRQGSLHALVSPDKVVSEAPAKSKRATSTAPAPLEWDTWVAIKLIDADQNPVPGARYRITLPDGSVKEGRLDRDGKARVESTKGGQCSITFLDIDGREWKSA